MYAIGTRLQIKSVRKVYSGVDFLLVRCNMTISVFQPIEHDDASCDFFQFRSVRAGENAPDSSEDKALYKELKRDLMI